MTRTGTIAWSVLGIISFAFLLLGGACIAIFGFALSIDAPHAWKGDIRDGLIFGLIALALILPPSFCSGARSAVALVAPAACRSARPKLIQAFDELPSTVNVKWSARLI